MFSHGVIRAIDKSLETMFEYYLISKRIGPYIADSKVHGAILRDIARKCISRLISSYLI